MAEKKPKEHLVATNKCVLSFGGWGKQFVVSVEDAMKMLSVLEHAEAFNSTYKDGKTITTVGGELPAVEVRLFSEQEYLEGLLNFETGADK